MSAEEEEGNSLEEKAPDEPDGPDELKEFFEKRRDEGKEDDEIIREVFEANPNADIKKLVEVTGRPALTIGRIKGLVSIRRKRDSRSSEKHLAEGEVSEPDARQLVAQFGREGLNKLKRGFLRKTLALAPGLADKTAEWILHKWDINPRVQDDPNVFYEMLHNDAGLKPNIAISIAKDVFSLEEQYADILEDKGEKPIFISGRDSRTGSPTGEPILYRRDQYSQSTGPFAVSGRGGQKESDSGGFLTKEEYLRMEREKEDRRRTEQLEDKRQQREDKFREDITNTLSSFKEELEKSKKPSEESSIEEIPIDAQGIPCAPENAVSVKKVYRGAGARADPFDMYLKIRQADKQDKTGQLDAEGVRRIFKDEVGSKPVGPSPEVLEIKGRLDGLNAQIVERDKKLEDLKDQLSEKDRQQLKDEIADLKGEMRSLGDRVSSGGVNSVEGMLTTVGGKLVDKNPLREATQLVKDLMTPGGTVVSSPDKAPAVTQATAGTPSGVVAALRDRGLVTTIRERVVGARQ